jgi:hypothetical protein
VKLPSPAVPGVITIASGLLIYEVVAGGGRPTVLTALTGLLLSPVALKLDEARRAEKAKDSTAEDTA